MRRINRRLVLLSVLIACDVVCVFGRPQEQNTAATQSKDDYVNRYTAFPTATPRSLDSVESYLSTSKSQYAKNVTIEKEDTRYAEPDPSLRPFFQFLLNSTKRKKRNLMKPADRRLVENFISYSINDLRYPNRADSLDSIILNIHAAEPQSVSLKHGHETQYLPVPIFTKVPRPKPAAAERDPVPSGTIHYHQTSTPDPYANWQETPLIFPDGNRRPPYVPADDGQRPPSYAPPSYAPPADYHHQHDPTDYQHQNDPFDYHHQHDPVGHDHQSPVFVTPIEYQGPTFVTPISVTQAPPPTIVILEDMDTVDASPQSDPLVEQDPATGVGGAGGGGAAAAAAAGAAAAAAAAGAGAGIVGISGGSAAIAATAGVGGGGGGALTPADVVQCRSGGGATKVCTELITTSSSTSTSSGSSSFLDGLIALFTSLNFFTPLALTFWSILFPPMAIILTSGLGVVSFLFPWLMPRIWFGRQLGGSSVNAKSQDRYQRIENPNGYHQPYDY